MTYSGKFNPDKYQDISDILTGIGRLEPGCRLTVKGLEPSEQSRVRSLIYDWLHHLSLKARFRVRAEPGRLEIIDRRLRNEVSLTVETPLTNKQEQTLMGELIENYETAEAVLQCWVSEGRITESRAKELKVKLEEVMS